MSQSTDGAVTTRSGSGWRQTRRQLTLYVVIGGVQLLADWLCFVALTWAGMDVVPANLLGRVFGACLGFWLNGSHTFASTPGRSVLGRKQALRFFIGWMLTTALSTGAVWLTDYLAGLRWAQGGKLCIDGALALLGFLLSKYWIFR
jgi:putative flippase GtrA